MNVLLHGTPGEVFRNPSHTAVNHVLLTLKAALDELQVPQLNVLVATRITAVANRYKLALTFCPIENNLRIKCNSTAILLQRERAEEVPSRQRIESKWSHKNRKARRSYGPYRTGVPEG